MMPRADWKQMVKNPVILPPKGLLVVFTEFIPSSSYLSRFGYSPGLTHPILLRHQLQSDRLEEEQAPLMWHCPCAGQS